MSLEDRSRGEEHASATSNGAHMTAWGRDIEGGDRCRCDAHDSSRGREHDRSRGGEHDRSRGEEN